MRSFRVGTIFGIPIQFNLSFLIVLPVFAWLISTQIGYFVSLFNGFLSAGITESALTGGVTPIAIGIVAAVGLFAGVVLHELGHSLTAMRYGFEIDSISLWLLGGIAQLTEMPEDWRQEFTVAIAGPLVSLALGVVSFGAFAVVPESLEAVRFLCAYLAVMNVTLAAFNLLPGFPMDGGRVLRALLARNRSYAVATQRAASVGKAVAFGLAIVGLLGGNLFLIVIALFVYMSASSESQQVTRKTALQGVIVADVMTPASEVSTVTPETSVADLVGLMFRERHTGYPVLANGELIGVVTLADAQSVREVERDAYRVEDIMETELTTIPSTSEAIDAFTEMQSTGVGRLPVVDGEFVGLLTRSDLLTALSILQSGGSIEAAGEFVGTGPGRPEEVRESGRT